MFGKSERFPEGWFFIKNVNTSYVLMADNDSDDAGTPIVLGALRSKDYRSQLWRVDAKGSLVNKKSGLVLDVAKGDTKAGVDIVQQAQSDKVKEDYQRFGVSPYGHIFLVEKPSLVLGIKGSFFSRREGLRVHLQSIDQRNLDQKEQLWDFVLPVTKETSSVEVPAKKSDSSSEERSYSSASIRTLDITPIKDDSDAISVHSTCESTCSSLDEDDAHAVPNVIFPEEPFVLKNNTTQFLISMENATSISPGSQIVIEPFRRGQYHSQFWTYNKSTHRIVNKHSGLVLTTKGDVVQDGVNIVQSVPSTANDEAQSWFLTFDGKIALKSHPEFVIGYNEIWFGDRDGAHLQLQKKSKQQKQKFTIVTPKLRKTTVPAKHVKQQKLPDGYFFLKNQDQGLVLTVLESSAIATEVVATTLNTSGYSRQLWKYDNGYLVNKASGLVLDVREGPIQSGATLCQYTKKDHDNQNQLWALSCDHTIFLQSNNDLVLTINEKENNFSKLFLSEKTRGHKNQVWTFIVPVFTKQIQYAAYPSGCFFIRSHTSTNESPLVLTAHEKGIKLSALDRQNWHYQLWSFSSGKLINHATDLVIDVSSNSVGSSLVQSDSSSQNWCFTIEGYLHYGKGESTLAVSVDNATSSLILAQYKKSQEFLWDFLIPEFTYSSNVQVLTNWSIHILKKLTETTTNKQIVYPAAEWPEGEFFIGGPDGHALVPESHELGSTIAIRKLDVNNSSNFRWTIRNGYLVHCETGLVLEAKGEFSEGAKLQLNHENGGSNYQAWTLRKDGSIASKHDEKFGLQFIEINGISTVQTTTTTFYPWRILYGRYEIRYSEQEKKELSRLISFQRIVLTSWVLRQHTHVGHRPVSYSSDVFPEGWIFIRSKGDENLFVTASNDDKGSQLILAKLDAQSWKRQLWRYYDDGCIANFDTDYVIDVADGKIFSSSKIIQWSPECSSRKHQMWGLSIDGRIHSESNASLVLGTTVTKEGAAVTLLAICNVGNQEWSFVIPKFNMSTLASYEDAQNQKDSLVFEKVGTTYSIYVSKSEITKAIFIRSYNWIKDTYHHKVTSQNQWPGSDEWFFICFGAEDHFLASGETMQSEVGLYQISDKLDYGRFLWTYVDGYLVNYKYVLRLVLNSSHCWILSEAHPTLDQKIFISETGSISVCVKNINYHMRYSQSSSSFKLDFTTDSSCKETQDLELYIPVISDAEYQKKAAFTLDSATNFIRKQKSEWSVSARSTSLRGVFPGSTWFFIKAKSSRSEDLVLATQESSSKLVLEKIDFKLSKHQLWTFHDGLLINYGNKHVVDVQGSVSDLSTIIYAPENGECTQKWMLTMAGHIELERHKSYYLGSSEYKSGTQVLLASSTSFSDVKPIEWKFLVPIFVKQTVCGSVKENFDVREEIGEIQSVKKLSAVSTSQLAISKTTEKNTYAAYSECRLIIRWWGVVFIRRISTCKNQKEYLEVIEQYRQILYSRLDQYLIMYGSSISRQERNSIETSIEETKTSIESEVFARITNYLKMLKSEEIVSNKELNIAALITSHLHTIDKKYENLIKTTKVQECISSSSVEGYKSESEACDDVLLMIETTQSAIRYWYRDLYSRIEEAQKNGGEKEKIEKIIHSSQTELHHQLVKIDESYYSKLSSSALLCAECKDRLKKSIKTITEKCKKQVDTFVSTVGSEACISIESWKRVTSKISCSLSVELHEYKKIVQETNVAQEEEIVEEDVSEISEAIIESSKLKLAQSVTKTRDFIGSWFEEISRDIVWSVSQSTSNIHEDVLTIIQAAELDVISKIDESINLLSTLISNLTHLSWSERRRIITYYTSTRSNILAYLKQFERSISNATKEDIIRICQATFTEEESSEIVKNIEQVSSAILLIKDIHSTTTVSKEQYLQQSSHENGQFITGSMEGTVNTTDNEIDAMKSTDSITTKETYVTEVYSNYEKVTESTSDWFSRFIEKITFLVESGVSIGKIHVEIEKQKTELCNIIETFKNQLFSATSSNAVELSSLYTSLEKVAQSQVTIVQNSVIESHTSGSNSLHKLNLESFKDVFTKSVHSTLNEAKALVPEICKCKSSIHADQSITITENQISIETDASVENHQSSTDEVDEISYFDNHGSDNDIEYVYIAVPDVCEHDEKEKHKDTERESNTTKTTQEISHSFKSSVEDNIKTTNILVSNEKTHVTEVYSTYEKVTESTADWFFRFIEKVTFLVESGVSIEEISVEIEKQKSELCNIIETFKSESSSATSSNTVELNNFFSNLQKTAQSQVTIIQNSVIESYASGLTSSRMFILKSFKDMFTKFVLFTLTEAKTLVPEICKCKSNIHVGEITTNTENQISIEKTDTSVNEINSFDNHSSNNGLEYIRIAVPDVYEHAEKKKYEDTEWEPTATKAIAFSVEETYVAEVFSNYEKVTESTSDGFSRFIEKITFLVESGVSIGKIHVEIEKQKTELCNIIETFKNQLFSATSSNAVELSSLYTSLEKVAQSQVTIVQNSVIESHTSGSNSLHKLNLESFKDVFTKSVHAALTEAKAHVSESYKSKKTFIDSQTEPEISKNCDLVSIPRITHTSVEEVHAETKTMFTYTVSETQTRITSWYDTLFSKIRSIDVKSYSDHSLYKTAVETLIDSMYLEVIGIINESKSNVDFNFTDTSEISTMVNNSKFHAATLLSSVQVLMKEQVSVIKQVFTSSSDVALIQEKLTLVEKQSRYKTQRLLETIVESAISVGFEGKSVNFDETVELPSTFKDVKFIAFDVSSIVFDYRSTIAEEWAKFASEKCSIVGRINVDALISRWYQIYLDKRISAKHTEPDIHVLIEALKVVLEEHSALTEFSSSELNTLASAWLRLELFEDSSASIKKIKQVPGTFVVAISSTFSLRTLMGLGRNGDLSWDAQFAAETLSACTTDNDTSPAEAVISNTALLLGLSKASELAVVSANYEILQAAKEYGSTPVSINRSTLPKEKAFEVELNGLDAFAESYKTFFENSAAELSKSRSWFERAVSTVADVVLG